MLLVLHDIVICVYVLIGAITGYVITQNLR